MRRRRDSVSAERGYLREAGNLLFHICLVTMLIGVAWGSLFSFRGTAIVVEGQAFSNTLTQYDEFGAGAGFRLRAARTVHRRAGRLRRRVRDRSGAAGRGAPLHRTGRRSAHPSGAATAQVLEVNAPLQVDGTSVHLLGHGYAPVVTVRDGNGDVAFSGPVVFLPQDAQLPLRRRDQGARRPPERLAFEGVFLPTAVADGANGLVSVFPDALEPATAGERVGRAAQGRDRHARRTSTSLDTTGLTQLTKDDGDPSAAGLEVGPSYDLPDGRRARSRFDGWKRWTKLQISDTPGGWLVLGSVLLAVLGMAVSSDGAAAPPVRRGCAAADERWPTTGSA